jgi:Tfp pilus assembly protein PilF
MSVGGIGLCTGASVFVGTMLSFRMHAARSAPMPPVAQLQVPAAPVVSDGNPSLVPPTRMQASRAPLAGRKGASTPAPPTNTTGNRIGPTRPSKGLTAPAGGGRSATAVTIAPPEPGVVQAGTTRTSAPFRAMSAAGLPVVSTPPAVPTPTVSKPAASASVPLGRRAADSLFKLAYAAHVRGNGAAAAADLYEKTLATQSAPSAAYNDYGVLLKERNDPAAAARMFRQAIAHDDTNVEAWVNLGDVLAGTGEHADALSAFARAGQLDPSRIAVKTRLAGQYQAIGDVATARQFFEDAVKLDPNQPGPHYALGQFLQSQHELSAAIREYERFVGLAPETYRASTIADVKQHIVALRKLVP